MCSELEYPQESARRCEPSLKGRVHRGEEGVLSGCQTRSSRYKYQPGTKLPPLNTSHSPPPRHSLMILPQVHLRKPCYDLYFL